MVWCEEEADLPRRPVSARRPGRAWSACAASEGGGSREGRGGGGHVIVGEDDVGAGEESVLLILLVLVGVVVALEDGCFGEGSKKLPLPLVEIELV